MHKMIGLLLVGLLLIGCQQSDAPAPSEPDVPPVAVVDPSEDDSDKEDLPDEEKPVEEAVVEEPVEEPGLTDSDYRAHRVNEMGEIMVIMYHNLAEENTTYARRLEDFRKDLETLYEQGYRPIALSDYVNGHIDAPLGTTPFVLTFDDGHPSNFRYIETEEGLVVDPDSVVGVLEDFHARYEAFPLEATFFLNGYTPFGQPETVKRKINYLIERGMDVGNHSYGHEHLPELTAEKIQETLGKNARQLEGWIDDPAYRVRWLALPFGQRPSDPERDAYVIAGSYEGHSYTHEAVLKVGWKPEVSPFDERFDGRAMHRVQSGDGELQLTEWLEIIEKSPGRRFVSDGNPDTVVVPRGAEEGIDREKTDGLEVILYDAE